MDNNTFLTTSDLALTQAADFFEETWPGADVDLIEGMLTVTLPTTQQYVINRHGVAQQIWVSSPFTGAHHFQGHQEKWECTRTQMELMDFLRNECRLYAA